MVFSLEMSKEQLVNRMLSMESRVDSQKLRTGTLSDSDWDAVVEGIGVIGNSKLIIDDTPGISIMELRSKCRKMKLEHGLSIVIIDYLQLMSGSGKGGENRQQEISEISRSLKALARELNAPVIALSQLSRACVDDLLNKGVALIGIDAMGIRHGADHVPTDQLCADQSVFVIENLTNLHLLLRGRAFAFCDVITAPMSFMGCSGIPCRVAAKLR